MSRMSSLHLEIQELVVDAIQLYGITYENDVLEYVNQRCSARVDMGTIVQILDEFYGEYFWNDRVIDKDEGVKYG